MSADAMRRQSTATERMMLAIENAARVLTEMRINLRKGNDAKRRARPTTKTAPRSVAISDSKTTAQNTMRKPAAASPNTSFIAKSSGTATTTSGHEEEKNTRANAKDAWWRYEGDAKIQKSYGRRNSTKSVVTTLPAAMRKKTARKKSSATYKKSASRKKGSPAIARTPRSKNKKIPTPTRAARKTNRPAVIAFAMRRVLK